MECVWGGAKVIRTLPVVRRLEGSGDGHVDVGGLVGRELGELGAELGQVQRGDLLVEVLGQHVDLLLVAAGRAFVPELELGNDLR